MHTSKQWLVGFLQLRSMDGPDGRPLYAYRCSSDEFGVLQSQLGQLNPKIDAGGVASASFALYTAEWWRRNYEGGPWKWEPLLASIGWNLPFHELYPRLLRAWRWWGIKPVVLNAHVRYLGTCACQGGIPLQVVTGNGTDAITGFLKALLREYRTFRRVVNDGAHLAESVRNHLPRTLRQEPVYRICADLMDQIWELRELVHGTKDPIQVLDQTDSQWRERMPVDLADQTARGIIEALLVEASESDDSSATVFKVVRQLCDPRENPKLLVDFQIPSTMATNLFGRLVGVDELPQRFELRCGSESPRAIASGRVSGEEVHFTKRLISMDWLTLVTAVDLTLSVFAGGLIGQRFTPRGGEALSTLPWVFIDKSGDGKRYEYYGEGSVRTRLPSLLVACPPDVAGELRSQAGTEQLEGSIEGRPIFRVAGEASLQTDNGICRFRTGQESESAFIHELTGIRSYALQSQVPVYLEPPVLYEVRYLDDFRAMMLVVIISIPLLALLRPVASPAAGLSTAKG